MIDDRDYGANPPDPQWPGGGERSVMDGDGVFMAAHTPLIVQQSGGGSGLTTYLRRGI
jgi:hypothetical protein